MYVDIVISNIFIWINIFSFFLFSIPVLFTSPKTMGGETFSACLILIKWSSLNYKWGATSARKTAGTDLAEVTAAQSRQAGQAAAAIGQWSVWSGKSWCMVVRVAFALTVLFTTMKSTCYYECYLFIGQWDSFFSDLIKCWMFHNIQDVNT